MFIFCPLLHLTASDFFFILIITELEFRQKKGQIDKDALLLTVEDPQARIGSGGATLNALLVVAEHLSQRKGHTVSLVLMLTEKSKDR